MLNKSPAWYLYNRCGEFPPSVFPRARARAVKYVSREVDEVVRKSTPKPQNLEPWPQPQS